MKSKMATKSQLSTTEPKKQKQKQKQTKQTTRTGTESGKWRSMEGYQWEGGGEECGGKVQGVRSIIGKDKIDRGRLRIL